MLVLTYLKSISKKLFSSEICVWCICQILIIPLEMGIFWESNVFKSSGNSAS